MWQGQLLATELIYTRQKYIVLDETQKFTKTDSQLPIWSRSRGLTDCTDTLNIDDPNLRSTVYKKTHYFFHKIKIFIFKIFLLVFFSNLRITSFAFCDLKKFKDFLLACWKASLSFAVFFFFHKDLRRKDGNDLEKDTVPNFPKYSSVTLKS